MDISFSIHYSILSNCTIREFLLSEIPSTFPTIFPSGTKIFQQSRYYFLERFNFCLEYILHLLLVVLKISFLPIHCYLLSYNMYYTSHFDRKLFSKIIFKIFCTYTRLECIQSVVIILTVNFFQYLKKIVQTDQFTVMVQLP